MNVKEDFFDNCDCCVDFFSCGGKGDALEGEAKMLKILFLGWITASASPDISKLELHRIPLCVSSPNAESIPSLSSSDVGIFLLSFLVQLGA